MSFDHPLPPYNASDPYATFLNVSCLDLLLIELVPLAERMARRLDEDTPKGSPVAVVRKGSNARGDGAPGGPVGGGGSVSVSGAGTEKERDDEPFKDAVYFRLEGLGFRVGQGLSERYVCCSCLFFLLCRGSGYQTEHGRHSAHVDLSTRERLRSK